MLRLNTSYKTISHKFCDFWPGRAMQINRVIELIAYSANLEMQVGFYREAVGLVKSHEANEK